MIVREWRARTVSPGDEAYVRHFCEHVLPRLATIPGYLGASLLRRVDGDGIELVARTRWLTLDHIRAFAGEDFERAVVAPEAQEVLVRWDERCRHFEVVVASDAAATEQTD